MLAKNLFAIAACGKRTQAPALLQTPPQTFSSQWSLLTIGKCFYKINNTSIPLTPAHRNNLNAQEHF